ncbi:MAG: DUF2298 domain-containing protein [Chloroflexota bacterium]
MFFDWLLAEGWMLPAWWVLVSLAGLAAFPLCTRLLGGLPDKGYTLARTTGMLLVAFVYWILASYGFVANSPEGMIIAWVLVLIVGLIAYFSQGERIDWRAYWRENRTVIIVAEVLFIVLFATMFIYRAYQNDTFTTEKPMEMAFISSVIRSETFPPNDPWMAGYAISYYYFGYVMAGMLSVLSGLHSGYGFSMMVALIFSLSGLTLFGVGYNFARSRAMDTLLGERPSKSPAIVTGLLATVFVLMMSNFQFPLIEMPFRAQSAPAEYFEWWGMRGFTDMEAEAYTQNNSGLALTDPFSDPDTWNRGWWWWHTSRILEDYDINGNAQEIIDEVPAFSFVLMDVHPHVLSLPFVVLAIGMALNIVLLRRDPNRYEILLYGITIGGLLFLNTWDAPMYLVVIVGADALRRLMRSGFISVDDWLGVFSLFGILTAIALIAYLPFLISFRSQAGGFIPNLLAPTPFRLYFLMFGPMLLLTGGFLIREAIVGTQNKRMNWRLGIMVVAGIFVGLLLLASLFIVVAWALPEVRTWVGNLVTNSGGWDVVLSEFTSRRLINLILLIVLFLGLTTIIARLFPSTRGKTDDASDPITYSPATGMGLLLIAAAFGITLVPEFVYLRDNFGTRINTIFKFYYQAWIMFGIASAYAVYVMVLAPREQESTSPALRVSYGTLTVVILVMCLPYFVFGLYSRAVLEQGRHFLEPERQAALTLDGRADGLSPDYFAAVQCLGELVSGDDAVVAEAPIFTGYNSAFGRVGAFYGIPTVINWEGHEGQWRGATYAETAGTRRPDIDTLYNTADWFTAQQIIDRYDIDYIMYGANESQQYGATGEGKFIDNLTVVCEHGTAVVYSTGNNITLGTVRP